MDMAYDVRINSCSLTDCKPTWSWETGENGFDDYDIWAVFRGAGSICVGESEFTIERGSFLILPPRSRIVARHDAQDPVLVRNVHFSLLEDGEEVFPLAVQYRMMEDVSLFEKLLDRVLICVYSAREEQAKIWMRAVLAEFFALGEKSSELSGGRSHAELIRKMCTAINDQKEESLEAFAKQYGYSAAYLGKLFHKVMGLPFSKYVLNVRINRAKRMLRSSEKSVSEIAQELDYCDVCFFIKQFRSVAGISPGRYRQQLFRDLE